MFGFDLAIVASRLRDGSVRQDEIFHSRRRAWSHGTPQVTTLLRCETGSPDPPRGYPEVTQRPDADRRRAWFTSYITTILQRDVRAMADIEGLAAMPRMLSFLVAQSGGLLNGAELSRDAGFSLPTARRYLTLLLATHLYQPLYACSGNVRNRLIKAPIEGTDRMIERAGQLCRRGGWTLVKTAKPNQDRRFDVPTVGPETIAKLKANGAGMLVVEAGKTVIIDRERMLGEADRAGIAVMGMAVGE